MQNYILTNNLINNIKLLLFAKTSEENQENHKKIPSKESESSYRYLANNLSIKEIVSSFSKINNRQSQLSFLSKDIKMTGTIEAESIIEIDCHFQGSIRGNTIVIRNNGFIEGEIEAKNIIIRGHFNGSIKTKQLQICNSAILTGKISYEQIKVEDGASVEGNFIKI